MRASSARHGDTTERPFPTTPPEQNPLGLIASALGGVFLAFGVAIILFVVSTAQAAPEGSSTRKRVAIPVAFGAVFAAMGAAFVGAGRRFWELQLEGAAFDERFVVPVYRRPDQPVPAAAPDQSARSASAGSMREARRAGR